MASRSWLGVPVAVVVLALVHLVGSSTPERVVVTTRDGQISGIRTTSMKGRHFYSFMSIPYAQPPVGKLRLKDPIEGKGWDGVRDGSVPPPECAQVPYLAMTSRQFRYGGDEDCLYLNIFSPRPGNGRAGLPVLVFIHGGAFFAGGAIRYTPDVILDRDVILVIVQYRLGILGFLSTEDSVMPGNYGLKDQTMALRWVQKNIDNFGGDPAKVTLFGESAGGASVHFHYLSPHSEGLFARGIMQSGTLFSPWAMGAAFREVAEYTGRLFGCRDTMGICRDQASEMLLQCLQEVDVQNLTLSLARHTSFIFSPVLLAPRVDGDYLPERPEVLMTQARHKTADIISGINEHEGALFTLPLYSDEHLKSQLVNNFPVIGPASLDLSRGDDQPQRLATKMFQHYNVVLSDDQAYADQMCQLYGDRHFNMGHDLVSQLYAGNLQASGSRVYLYTLTHRGQRSFSDYYPTQVGKHWVCHVDDLFYLFSGEHTLWKPLEREDDLRLRDIITQMWMNFAETGNPTPDDSLEFTWEATEPSTLRHLNLTVNPTMMPYQRQEVLEFWMSLPLLQNKLLAPDKVVPFPPHDHQEVGKGEHASQHHHHLNRPLKHQHDDL